MTSRIIDNNKSIQEPEVQEMLKRLSNYGLGVFMPHMHAESGAFVELPRGMVQVEDNLRVSFKPRSEASGSAVGWVWDSETMVAEVCRVCVPDDDGGHKYASTTHEDPPDPPPHDPPNDPPNGPPGPTDPPDDPRL